MSFWIGVAVGAGGTLLLAALAYPFMFLLGLTKMLRRSR